LFVEGGEKVLTKGRKEELVAKMTDDIKASQIVVVLDYKGMSVESIGDFRSAIRPSGGTLTVFKNTLLKISLKNSGFEYEALHSSITHTNAVLLVKEDGDPMAALKALVKFEKANKLPTIKIGVFEDQLFDADGIRELSKLPSRHELLGMLANVMEAPITGVTRALNGIILRLAYALNAVQEKKGE